MRNILTDHASRYPAWTVEDLYKLIHQSAMGSEHAVKDEVAARKRLIREIGELGHGPEEPLVDPISPDGLIIRVHLRPYARVGFDDGLLLQAFLRTAREFRGCNDQVEKYGEVAVELAREGKLQVREDDVIRFFAEMRTSAYPAVHHSRVFEERYRPAYRVVCSRFIHAEILSAVQP
jgi:hypothetical protein